MNKTDICKQALYITELSRVIEATNRNHSKPFFINGRHSDAFVYIIEGGCLYTFDDGECFSVGEGDVLYLASAAVYRMDVDEGDYHYIYCDFEFNDAAPRRSAVYSPKNTAEVYHAFRKMHHVYTSRATGAHGECLSFLYRIYATLMQSESASYVGKSAREKITEIREYVDANCHNVSLSVAHLAERAGISDVHLRKLFHSIYGTSPLAYITSVRIERAKQLMQYPFLSLEECATQSGFSSLAYFSRVFRATVGISPSAYRKANKKET